MATQKKIKAAAIADIHWDARDGWYVWPYTITEIISKDIDVLLICGDIAVSIDAYQKALLELSKICDNRLVVLGNHDIWIRASESFKDSWEKYNTKNDIALKMGFYSLEKAPVIINKVGFVGNMGWYDYSLRDKSLDKKYPLADVMYKMKQFPNGRGRWMDGVYAKWGMTDEDVTKYFADRLESDILSLYDKCDRICIVMHHVPAEPLVTRKDESWNMGNAFVGSEMFQKVIEKYDKISYIFCGHTHTYFNKKINGVRYINVGADYGQPKYVEVKL